MKRPSIEICIPAYNEAPVIAETVRAVSTVLEAGSFENWRVTVAENGSTDGTADVVRALKMPNVFVLSTVVRGKGAAVVAAARVSRADLFGFIDADLSADPTAILDLVKAIEDGADLAIGSRLHPQARTTRDAARTLSSRIFNGLRKLIVGIPIYDSQCGLKLANAKGRALLAECAETGWFFEIEWLLRAQDAGLIIEEIPISWTEFRFPERKSKLRVVKDGVGAIIAFVRIRRAREKRI